MSPKAKHELARDHLNRALDNVQTDESEAAYWLFMALEAAVVALAESESIDVRPTHPSKVSAAVELHTRQVLPSDLSEILRVLNQARKDTIYEGDELNLEGWDLEDIAAEVEGAVNLAEERCV